MSKTEAAEYPLLNEPNVMLVALRAAADGPATPEEGLQRLEAGLRLAGVSAPPDRDELRSRIASAYHCLRIALLVDMDAEGRFVATPRGHSTLKQHPNGIDSSVLAQFPEFRAFLRDRSRERSQGTVNEPTGSYNEGYATALTGGAITDNPYPEESIAHLEWENGWCEGFEQNQRYIPSL